MNYAAAQELLEVLIYINIAEATKNALAVPDIPGCPFDRPRLQHAMSKELDQRKLAICSAVSCKTAASLDQSINQIFNVLGTNWGPTDKSSVQ